MKPERLLPMILVIAGAAVCFYSYRQKTTVSEVPQEFQNDPAVVLFYKHQCVTCHWVTKLPEARGKLGPGLDNIGSRALEIDPEHKGEDFLKESLVDPAKVVRAGFVNGMPSFKDKLTERELDLLVSWLLSLKEETKE